MLYFTEKQYYDADKQLEMPSHADDMNERLHEIMAQNSIDQHQRAPGGFNMAADILLGGTEKVAQQVGLTIHSGMIQGAFVLVPLLIPSIRLWIRKQYPNSGMQQRYLNENVPFLTEEHEQITHLLLSTGYLATAALNNLYCKWSKRLDFSHVEHKQCCRAIAYVVAETD